MINLSASGTKHRIPIENRGKIVALREMGLSYRKIATRISYSVGAVRAVVRKQHQTGTVAGRPITARKRITTERQDRLSLADRRKTAPQIRAYLEKFHDTQVSGSAVKRRRLQVGLKAY